MMAHFELNVFSVLSKKKEKKSIIVFTCRFLFFNGFSLVFVFNNDVNLFILRLMFMG